MKCRYCSKEIRFIRRPNGKAIPVLAEKPKNFYLHLDQPGHPQRVIVMENGEIVKGREGTAHDSGDCRVVGWESHFADCPGAAQDGRESLR